VVPASGRTEKTIMLGSYLGCSSSEFGLRKAEMRRMWGDVHKG